MNGAGEIFDDLTHYRFAQAFGERATAEVPQEVDLISAVQFSRTGDLIATGDKGGRVVILQRIDAGRGEALRREQVARATRRSRLVQRETSRTRGNSSSCSSQGRLSTGLSPVPIPRSPRIAVVGPRWSGSHSNGSYRRGSLDRSHLSNCQKLSRLQGTRARESYLDDSGGEHESDSSESSASESSTSSSDERSSAASTMEMVSPPAGVSHGANGDVDLELNECDVLMTSCADVDDHAFQERSRTHLLDALPGLRSTPHVPLDDEVWDDRERASDGRNADADDGLRPDRSRIPAFVPEYRFWTQFQSHEPEFDYLKSLEIEEKINQIRWCRDVSGAYRLLTTNDKTIKLWRVFERQVRQLVSFDNQTGEADTRPESHQALRHHDASADPSSAIRGLVERPAEDSSGLASAGIIAGRNVCLPRLRRAGSMVIAVPKRIFSNAHAYHINSISLNSDEETFLSADDLRINIWNLENCSTGFNVVDIKPENMEDLTEVITAAEFHPHHCNLFLYSSSRGVLKLCDLRVRALCDQSCREYEEPEDPANRSFFSEIIASTSDVTFSHSGRYVLARDYMTLKLWDINMEKRPLLTIPVHESLRSRLCELYENDCIFDKFQCAFSADDASVLTGSYGNQFQVYSSKSGRGLCYEASVDFVSSGRPPRLLFPNGMSCSIETMTDASGSMGGVSSSPPLLSASGLGPTISSGVPPEPLLPTQSPNARRVLHVAAHPLENIAAVAAGPALYLYNAVLSPCFL
jgi:serine/threonine-protein phosphatase 2A regulatory subunit B